MHRPHHLDSKSPRWTDEAESNYMSLDPKPTQTTQTNNQSVADGYLKFILDGFKTDISGFQERMADFQREAQDNWKEHGDKLDKSNDKLDLINIQVQLTNGRVTTLENKEGNADGKGVWAWLRSISNKSWFPWVVLFTFNMIGKDGLLKLLAALQATFQPH